MATYHGLETTFSLFTSYELLSRNHKRNNNPKEALSNHLEEIPQMNYNNYGFTFALLNLNAAMLEGIMRSILCQIVADEKDRQVSLGKKVGQTERSPIENVLNKFSIDIDSSGGWEKLKEQYSTYLNIQIVSRVLPETKEAIETLFLLRDIFSHGTALIYPISELKEDSKDEHVYKWQNRLKGANVYLTKHFKHDNIFHNLADYDVPEHFLEKTKNFLNEILPVLNYSGSRSQKTIKAILDYSFGYVRTDLIPSC